MTKSYGSPIKRLDCGLGEHIASVCKRAVEFVGYYDHDVEVAFNGTTFIVSPGMSEADAFAAYGRQVQIETPKENPSPGGVKLCEGLTKILLLKQPTAEILRWLQWFQPYSNQRDARLTTIVRLIRAGYDPLERVPQDTNNKEAEALRIISASLAFMASGFEIPKKLATDINNWLEKWEPTIFIDDSVWLTKSPPAIFMDDPDDIY